LIDGEVLDLSAAAVRTLGVASVAVTTT
jgi:hypothetical protein